MITIETIISWFTVNPLSTLALILSTTGAFLVSGKSQKWRFRGFNIWIISNGIIGYDYYLNQNIPMVLLFMGFYQICNLRGVLSNGGRELLYKIFRKESYNNNS